MTRWLLLTLMALGLTACAKMHESKPQAKEAANEKEEVEPGEVKVKLDQAPLAVRKTVEQELQNAQLEDIARKQKAGKTVYETDIIRNDGKWEVIVAEDGSILEKNKEGNEEEVNEDKKPDKGDGWKQTFEVDKSSLQPTGNNQYLPIQPGKVQKLKNADADTLTVTILPETQTIDGVKCGILEERETKNGQLIEVSRNFMACDPATGDVYYFGEDVDNYKDGKVVNHESAWRAGEKGAKFGLMVPGKPSKGDKFYQEIAPKVAMDRVEIVSTDESVKTPAGTIEHCIHLKETTPLESDVSHKYYAPGIGIAKDDEFELAEK